MLTQELANMANKFLDGGAPGWVFLRKQVLNIDGREQPELLWTYRERITSKPLNRNQHLQD